MTERRLIAYAFPLADVVCTLHLPMDGLSAGEAARLKDYVDSLVTRAAAFEEEAPESPARICTMDRPSADTRKGPRNE